MFSGVLVCIKLTPRLSRDHSPRPSSSPSRGQALSFTSTSTLSLKGSGGAAGGFDSGHVGSLGAAGGAGMQLAGVRGVGPSGCVASQCFLSLFVRVPNFKMKCEYILCVGAM